MKLIIDIPENVIEGAKSSPNYYPTYHFEKIWRAIANGIPYEEKTEGEWILNKDDNPECPFCHHSFTYWGNFCGNCGRRLSGEGEEE